MESTTITGASGVTLSLELHKPAGAANGAAVIVVYGSDGMNKPWADMIRAYAVDLAKKGFLAIIPDYLATTGSRPGPDVFVEIPRNRDRWQAAVNDAISHASATPGITAGRIGLLGFSLGGHLSLRLRSRARAVTAFFAPQFAELGGIGAAVPPVPHAQLHHGSADQLVPPVNSANFEGQLNGEGTTTAKFLYTGAGHGFAGKSSADATARRDSRKRTIEFLVKHL